MLFEQHGNLQKMWELESTLESLIVFYPPSRHTGAWIAAAVVAIAIIVAIASNAAHSNGDSESAPDPAIEASIMAALKPTTPPGYTAVTDDGVAWVWEKDATTKKRVCGALYGEGCSVLKVQATYGCSSLYVEANLLDSAGTVVGFTNGIASHLAPGTVAEVELVYYGQAASTISLTEINCN